MKISLKNIPVYIYITWGLWYAFFNASLTLRPMYEILWPSLVAVGALFGFNNIKKSMEFQKTLIVEYILFFMICFLSLCLSNDIQLSGNYFIRIILAFIFAVVVSGGNYEIILIKCISFFSIIMLIFSLTQLLFPNIYLSTVLPLVSLSDSSLVVNAVNGGEAVGLTNGTSQNGLFMAIGFVFFATKAAVLKKNKIVNFVVSALFFGMTFITGKRSYSLIVVAIFFLLLYLGGKNRNQLYRFLKVCFGGIMLVLLFNFTAKYIPALNNVLNKSVRLSEEGDISHGRFDLYKNAWLMFKNYPFFGIGLDASGSVLGGAVHNSYLQWLVEFGLVLIPVPLITILYIPIFKLKRTIYIIKNETDESEKFVKLSSFLFLILVIFAGIVATPFQWSNVFMLYMIFQMILLKKLTMETRGL